MKKIELLAPAGNMNGLKAAIIAGADAIYVGGYAYSARGYADNFSNDELVEAINYAHLNGVKIYVAVNTLIYDDEVEIFINYIDFLHKNNVDAIIIQDLGMFDLIRKMYPNLEIHASTQMHIHNVQGAMFAKKYGMKRVVLARETSIEMIREIKKSVDIDLEVFCHGALCVSYSGQCLMSSLIGGRSGNRGICAGTCRLPYDLVDKDLNKLNKDKYLLSMKDLNTVEYVGELINAGVTSLKIEGRMKREEYIYQVVSIYRKAIDSFYLNGKVLLTNSDLLDLRKIYNRMFTKGFLFNEKNNNVVNQFRPNHQGIKIGKVVKCSKDIVFIKLTENIKQGDGIRIINKLEDVGLQLNFIYKDKSLVNEAKIGDIISVKVKNNVCIDDVVLKTTDIFQINSIQKILNSNLKKTKIDCNFIAKKNNPMILILTDSINKVEVKSDSVVAMAKTSPISCEQISKQLKKLGDTVYEINKLKIDIDNDIFISVRELNELRRVAIAKLDELRKYNIPYKKNKYYIDVPKFKRENNFNYYICSINQYNNLKSKNICNIYVDNLELFNNLKSDTRVLYKLPRVMTDFKNYNGTLLVGELGSLNYYNDVITDFSFNVTNSYTVAFLHSIGVKKVTLSYELDLTKIENLINNYINRYNCYPNLEVILYGYPELMVSKFKLLSMYERCGNNFYLRDRYNKLYNIIEKDNLMYIYDSKLKDDLKSCGHYFEIGINNIRINILRDEELKNVYMSKM